MRINQGITTSICNDDLSFKKELNLLVVKKITDFTPSQIINVSLNKPSEIKLADYKFSIPGKTDVLLGAEIFYELLRPGQIYCGDSRLLLQNTVFGYVVSGSVRNYLDDAIIEKVTNPFVSTSDPVLYFPHQVIIKNESLTTKQQIAFDASACERRLLKEEMGSEKSDEEMELPQATERVIPLESERAKMLSVGSDAKAQPVTVPEEKCLPRALPLLISADEMCEEKEERSVDVIKETAKEDISREPLNLNNDEIEEINHRKCGL
ncbi:integrase catalytic domain-containing protein [Trichonephila clavipes]|nr:integrase catalytic domain-containing protein [Trichonephila clavipes]